MTKKIDIASCKIIIYNVELDNINARIKRFNLDDIL